MLNFKQMSRYQTPFVSVILPCRYPPNALLELLEFRLKHDLVASIELVLIAVSGIEWPSEMESTVNVYIHEMIGAPPGEARNAGIRHARGTWIAFCDDDDVFALPELLKALAELRGEVGFDLISCGYQVKQVNGEIVSCAGATRSRDLLLSQPLAFWRNIYLRSFLKSNAITFPGGLVGEDIVFMARLISHNPKLFCSSHAFYTYVRTAGSSSSTRDNRWLCIPSQMTLAHEALRTTPQEFTWWTLWRRNAVSGLLSVGPRNYLHYLRATKSTIIRLGSMRRSMRAARIFLEECVKALLRALSLSPPLKNPLDSLAK